jgi:hypothetical protein
MARLLRQAKSADPAAFVLRSDEPIEIRPHDSREVRVSIDWGVLGTIPSETWNLEIRARNGDVRKLLPDEVLGRERRLPRWLKRLMPSVLRLQWWAWRERAKRDPDRWLAAHSAAGDLGKGDDGGPDVIGEGGPAADEIR